MIHIEPYAPHHTSQIISLKIADGQERFTLLPEGFISESPPHLHRHVILLEGTVIGYFRIDTAYPENYPFCPQTSLGLRALLIDSRQQGKGYGQAAMAALPMYLRDVYPDHHAVYLTVNCQNPVAHRCYIKAGFDDTKELYLGGPAGPQHIMRMDLINR
ncbi:hypothetical protein ABT57_13835 [Photobacterium ganghwense]|uniref:N-acetyltransferase domain-containing protein n=1 Tax=Photobacterium ganghwense TaxID=320778 RepID=A0A0J1H8D0_9GAMM|nr:GNAT family N-acetyltransferase [Photobacterium ganghwense]KLV07931.1 hypothetical protein ABT57_13835 [Photobacterium ganghwense]QSV15788.1 GNAT family N-acetyltransferase [Photobacterium ganghwense]